MQRMVTIKDVSQLSNLGNALFYLGGQLEADSVGKGIKVMVNRMQSVREISALLDLGFTIVKFGEKVESKHAVLAAEILLKRMASLSSENNISRLGELVVMLAANINDNDVNSLLYTVTKLLPGAKNSWNYWGMFKALSDLCSCLDASYITIDFAILVKNIPALSKADHIMNPQVLLEDLARKVRGNIAMQLADALVNRMRSETNAYSLSVFALALSAMHQVDVSVVKNGISHLIKNLPNEKSVDGILVIARSLAALNDNGCFSDFNALSMLY